VQILRIDVMSLYSRFLFPRVLDFAMKHEELTNLREKMIQAARGVVLEVGIGSGLNLPFYTSSVTKLYALEPSAELLTKARTRSARAPFPIEWLNSAAELIHLPDSSVDTVVVTWSLCSMQDPSAALGEMSRVLRPDGRLIFIEHGLSPDAGVQSWQNRLTPVWRRLAGGCHLNRKMDDLIRSAGFSIATLDAAYIPGPRPLTYTYVGMGTRR
jgi:ubiquinone/menaquinone biosynthesis C-methylase UbiE